MNYAFEFVGAPSLRGGRLIVRLSLELETNKWSGRVVPRLRDVEAICGRHSAAADGSPQPKSAAVRRPYSRTEAETSDLALMKKGK